MSAKLKTVTDVSFVPSENAERKTPNFCLFSAFCDSFEEAEEVNASEASETAAAAHCYIECLTWQTTRR